MNDTPEKPIPLASDYFRKMAAAIDHNAEKGNFGGAFVILPPKDGGDVVETLILDSTQDAAQFWTLLKTKCDVQIRKADEASRHGQAFQQRR